MYAYMVGGVCNIITGMDPPATEYLVTLDLLNQFAADAKLPQALRERLRDYFSHVRPRFRERHYNLDPPEYARFASSLKADLLRGSFPDAADAMVLLEIESLASAASGQAMALVDVSCEAEARLLHCI